MSSNLIFSWTYYNKNGDVVGYVDRLEKDDGAKYYLPRFKKVGSKFSSGLEEGVILPLYGLSSLDYSKKEILVVEGEKCAAALQGIGFNSVTSQGGANASNRTNWEELGAFHEIYLIPDNDDAGAKYVKDASLCISKFLSAKNSLNILYLPNLKKGGDIVDWIMSQLPEGKWNGFDSIHKLDQVVLEEKLRELLKTAQPYSSESSHWSSSIKPENTNTLPTWPNNVLPRALEHYCKQLSSVTETPPELSTLMSLAMVAACAQKRFKLRVNNEYYEQLCIWVAVALKPGNRKSEVLSKLRQPIVDWEQDQLVKMKDKAQFCRIRNEVADEQVKNLKKSLGRASNNDVDQIVGKIAVLESKKERIRSAPRLWTADVTPEKIASIMAENDEAIAVISDEGGIFDLLNGRYNNNIPNLDTFLQGFSGSSIRIDRASGETISLNSPRITMALTPQPSVLKSIGSNSNFRGRGLLGRFAFVLPKSPLGYRALGKATINKEAYEEYRGLLFSILNFPNNHESTGLIDLYFSESAYVSWIEHAREFEPKLRDDGLFAELTDWGGKYPGLVARISGLIHIATTRDVFEVGSESVNKAIEIGKFLQAHALHTFFDMRKSEFEIQKEKVLAWIKSDNKESFTFRDCFAKFQSLLKKTENLQCILREFQDLGLLREVNESSGRGRPSRRFEINPILNPKLSKRGPNEKIN